MSIFKKAYIRKHLDDLVDLMNFKNVPLPLYRLEKGEYKIVWFDQDIPAKLSSPPAIENRRLTEFSDMFVYTDYLLNLWFDDYNNMMRSLGCKKQFVVGEIARNELQTQLILALCNDYDIENPYLYHWPENATIFQMSDIMGDRSASIYFRRRCLDYDANIGGHQSWLISFPADVMEKALGFDPSTRLCRASKADVVKLGEKTVKRMEDAYSHVFEEHGVKNFVLHPEVKRCMAHHIASVLCRDYNITE